jgi:hypothetical protein
MVPHPSKEHPANVSEWGTVKKCDTAKNQVETEKRRLYADVVSGKKITDMSTSL